MGGGGRVGDEGGDRVGDHEGGGGRVGDKARLLFCILELVAEPVESLVEPVARGGAGRLDVPVPSTDKTVSVQLHV